MLKSCSPENIASYVENLIAGICHFRIQDGKIIPVYVNEGCRRMLGYNHHEMELLLSNLEQNIIQEDLPILHQGLTDILKDDGPVEFELRTVTLNGNLRWLQIRGNLYTKTKQENTVVCVLLDITEKKAMEEEMLLQAERLNLIVQSQQEILMDYNAKTDVLVVRKMERNGIPKENIWPAYFEKFDLKPYHPEDVEALLGLFKQLLKKQGQSSIEYRNSYFTSEYRWYHLTLSSIADMDGYVTRVVGRMLDIEERKIKELELTRRAEKDSLSGLYNKGAATDLITETLRLSAPEDIHALMVVDLDNFKSVNDNLGHSTGDSLIERAAGKIVEIFKGTDIIGRIGGDEFVVFMKNIGNIANADILAARLVEELRTNYESAGGRLNVTCSIGIAIYPYHGTHYQELFDKADKALYYIKENGKNSYRIYDAAATRACHASRKSFRQNMPGRQDSHMELEDVIMDILYEEKDKRSAFETVLELVSLRFGWQRAYAYSGRNIYGEDSWSAGFVKEGYEWVNEPKDNVTGRESVYESFCDLNRKLTVYHDYDSGLNDRQLQYMSDGGIHSIIYYPFILNDRYNGCIVFERIDWKDIIFTQKEMLHLMSILRILDTYMQNNKLIHSLPHIITQIKLMDNLDNYVYVVDMNTYRLTFVNKKVLETTPNIKIGEKCHRVFGNSDKPCHDCILNRLDPANPHDRCSEDRFNYCTRTAMHYSASWLECTAHTMLALMDCVDISAYLPSDETRFTK